MIEILNAGALTTIQDEGRTGFAAKGYPSCGAADVYAMRLANILAGNGAHSACAVLEFTLVGATLRFNHAATIALTGADMCAQLTTAPTGLFVRESAPITRAVARFTPFTVQAGDVLTLGAAQVGIRAYLAVYGGIDSPLVMGSRATDLKCHIGGMEGRALQKGDHLPLAKIGKESLRKGKRLMRAMQKGELTNFSNTGFVAPQHPWRVQGDVRVPLLRAVLGPQEDAFTEQGLATFTKTRYALTADSNRMACKLHGAPIETVHGSDILSDGIIEGSIQVSSDGSPIVMLADHQTTGGYAKIATLIHTDVAVVAQLRPGDEVAFRFVSAHEGALATRKEEKTLNWIAQQLA